MSQNLPDNYVDEVPDDVDMSQEEWESLGYHGQYHHAERDKDKFKRVRAERKDRKKNWIKRIKAELGCRLCEEDNPVCLVYHHVDEKKHNMADVPRLDLSKEKIKKELNKCVVLCANCHRKVHSGDLDVNQKI